MLVCGCHLTLLHGLYQMTWLSWLFIDSFTEPINIDHFLILIDIQHQAGSPTWVGSIWAEQLLSSAVVASSQRGPPTPSEWSALGLGGGQVGGMGDRGLAGAGRIGVCVAGGGGERQGDL